MSDLTPELCQRERSRMSQRDASEVEVEADSELSASSKAAFLDKVRQSNAACQSGDFETAVALYGEAIALDPLNHILYSNRSAAFIKLGQFNRALQDANKACEVNPKWPKAYYRQGVALQCLARHSDALAAFSSGLAQDPKSLQLLAGLVEAAVKSPLRTTFEPTYRQLQAMRLDKSPFVIISVIGQELLAAGHYQSSVVVLESALRIGTCSLKLRGSVFSALSSAYWALSSLDKAISYMQQDLSVAKSLGDTAGEIRAHGNLGSAYFSKGNYKEALTSHRYQLVLAMKCKDNHAAAAALTSLGHVYTAIGDYPNALASHKQCLQLVKQLGDRLQEAREVGNVGAVYLAMADFDAAVNCHLEHLRIAKQLKNSVEMARAYSNLGSSHHFRRNFEQAITFHNHVLRIAEEIGIKGIEARAYAGLGHAARCMGDYTQAKRWHERQLDMALSTRDKVSEGRSLSNLGIVYQLLGDHDAALKLHQAHLNIARVLQDRAGMGRAYGNIGNAYSAMGYYEQAIKYHKQELTISKEVNDRSSEASTHGNLAVAYQALHMHDMAILHYHSHLNIARELKDTAGEACALLNLGNCHSSRGEFSQAVSFYENYLMLSQELQDVEGEAKACHFLGYAHYCLGNFKEAIRYYDQDLTLAKDLQDKMNMGRAYCNLGLAHLALGNSETALECQKYFLTIAHMTKHVVGKFRALGNIGDILVKMNNFDEAINVYSKQLQLAKQVQDKGLAASGYAALGLVHRHLRCFDKALGYYTQELTLRQESGDIKGECRSHGHLAAVHMALGNYTHAIKCYEEQLDRAKELRDSAIEAQVYGNLGIARLNMGHYEEAIGYFEQQLATLEQLSTTTALLDKGRAFGNLGDCYDALGDFEEAIKCHEQFLAIALKTKSLRDQERAYRGLGQSHRCLANLQQALVCFEKRLVVAHELNSPVAKGQAYGELGQLHSQLGNFEQAVSCLEHQLAIARELNDKSAEAEAASGLGCVFQAMGEYNQALQYHQLDLKLAEVSHNASFQCRAYGNLGVAHEALGQCEQAILYQEQHLSIAAQINDKVAKTMAFASLGRVHQTLGRTTQAIAYLQQGLQIAESLGRKEDEAKIRHRLGLALWSQGDLEPAHTHLDRAATLLEAIRREARSGADYRLSLFDLQTECYHVLQRILVLLNRPYEALLVAERGRTRAFVDLLLERQGAGDNHIREHGNRAARLEDSTPSSVEQMTDIVNKQKAAVLYYSLAAGYLYSWLIVPSKGVVSFHQVSICEAEQSEDSKNEGNVNVNPSMLEQYIQSVRDALGVEMQTPGTREGDAEGDVWSQHMEELGDKLNQDGDRTVFLRMVNRSHAYNSSNYSLSSLFSLGSLSGSITSGSTSRPGSTRSRRSLWQGPSCLRALYDLLIAPMESSLQNQDCHELMLVLEGDLYLVPFPVLKSPNCSEYLCERFSIIVVPSLSSLKSSMRKSKGSLSNNTDSEGPSQACVVGNPRLPATVTEQWGWGDIPYSEQEANVVGEMLQTVPLTGQQATKEAVIRQLAQAECIHLATHVSWKLSAIVLSPGDFVESSSKTTPASSSHPSSTSAPGSSHDEECTSDMASSIDLPALSEFLLTAADILHLRLSARLVVISAVHTRDHHGWAHSDGVVGLSRALLAAGAQCVLLALWPVPDTAVKILFRTFYSSLMQGSRVSRALAEAQQTVQHTKHFAHPANWAGYLLIGLDIRLSNKVALMGQALAELLKLPENCRDALRVTLHLVEKSLQRIHRGHKNAMYTTQRSIENKVGVVSGWKELLISVGFRFEPAANNIPASVFFPQSDPGERLTQCSASLQALLGLSTTSLLALAKLLSNPESGDEIIHVMRHVTSQFALRDLDTESVEIPVAVKLWRLPGCHELLASLGFDLMEVGRDEVTLRTSKQANKRQIQFALQALLALFDTQEAPKSLSVDSSSSVESFPSDDEVEEHNTQREMPLSITYSNVVPASTARRFPLPLANSSKSAFTNYVRSRSRGEPDGRTAVTNEVRGRESDAAFTPSPVDLPPKKMSSSLMSTLAVALNSNDNIPSSNETNSAPVPSLRMSLTLAHQNRIRSMYCSNPGTASSHGTGSPSSDAGISMGLARPESSSSTSSVTDWENGQSTVRRQPVKHLPPLNRRVGDVSAFAHLPHAMAVNRMKEAAQAESNAQSSDSELSVRKLAWKSGHSNGKKLGSTSASMAGSLDTLDRLSVRSEVGNLSTKGNPSVVEAAKRRNRSTERSLQEDVAADYGRFMTAKLHLHPPGPKPNAQFSSNANNGLNRPNEVDLQNAVYSLRSAAEEFHHTQSSLGTRNIQDHILATQLSRLEREFPISEVYHERDVGLGLAPSLSKILMTTTTTEENSFVAANVAASTSEELFSTFDKMALDHVSPPKRAVTQRPWLSSKLTDEQDKVALADLTRRDEADGRSMTDSNYSGYSPNRNLAVKSGANELKVDAIVENVASQKKVVLDRTADKTGKSNTVKRAGRVVS